MFQKPSLSIFLSPLRVSDFINYSELDFLDSIVFFSSRKVIVSLFFTCQFIQMLIILKTLLICNRLMVTKFQTLCVVYILCAFVCLMFIDMFFLDVILISTDSLVFIIINIILLLLYYYYSPLLHCHSNFLLKNEALHAVSL